MKRKKIFVCLYSLFFLLYSSSVARAAEKYGIVVRFTGEVNVRPAGERAFRPMKQRDFLYVGDAVRTGPGSQVAVMTTDGTEIKIDEGSITILDRVLEQDERGASRWSRSMFMEKGRSWMKLLRRGRADTTIRSNVGVCAVRGTEFTVDVSPVQGKKKIKVKKSAIRKKGLVNAKKALQEAMERESTCKGMMSEAALDVKKKKKEADEADKKSRLAMKEADKSNLQEAKKKAEEMNKASLEAKKAHEEALKNKDDQSASCSNTGAAIKSAKQNLKAMEKLAKKVGKGDDGDEEIEVDEQMMGVGVLAGLVEFSNDQGKQNVGAGQVLMVSAGEAPKSPKAMSDKDKPSWQDKIEMTDEEKSKVLKELMQGGKGAAGDKTLNMEVQDENGATKKIKLKFKKQ